MSAETSKFTYIRELALGMKNVNCHFIALDVAPARKTKDGHDVRNVRVADRSGSVLVSVWDEVGACLQPGDICRLLNGYVAVHKNCLMLNVGCMGEMQKVGEFCMLFSETPFMSAPNIEYAKSADQQKQPAQLESILADGGASDPSDNNKSHLGSRSS